MPQPLANRQTRQARKRALITQSALLRRRLGQDYTAMVSPAERLLDRVVGAGQWLRERPWLLGGMAALWLVWRPRRATSVMSLGGRLWVAWQAWRRWQPLIRPMMGLVSGMLSSETVVQAGGRPVSPPHRGMPRR